MTFKDFGTIFFCVCITFAAATMWAATGSM